jgi:hypothetical protein
MNNLLAGCALLVMAAPALAQNNLEPDDMIIESSTGPGLYGHDYAGQLLSTLDNTVRVFDIIEGGLVPKFVVGIKTVGNGYRIFMVGSKSGGGADRCEAPIANDLAHDVITAWDKVVLQTRFNPGQPSVAADGPAQHFGSRLQFRTMVGRVLETPPDSNPANLGRIAGGLLQICSKERLVSVPQAVADIKLALSRIH